VAKLTFAGVAELAFNDPGCPKTPIRNIIMLSSKGNADEWIY